MFLYFLFEKIYVDSPGSYIRDCFNKKKIVKNKLVIKYVKIY